eukprot:Hpha_TRINITY_DN16213_c0_g1::TRINITY_DN16213_c0_g1_i2::g.13145::m.13145
MRSTADADRSRPNVATVDANVENNRGHSKDRDKYATKENDSIPPNSPALQQGGSLRVKLPLRNSCHRAKRKRKELERGADNGLTNRDEGLGGVGHCPFPFSFATFPPPPP